MASATGRVNPDLTKWRRAIDSVMQHRATSSLAQAIVVQTQRRKRCARRRPFSAAGGWGPPAQLWFFARFVPNRQDHGNGMRNEFGWPCTLQISHRCHRRACCRIDHLIAEEQWQPEAQLLRRRRGVRLWQPHRMLAAVSVSRPGRGARVLLHGAGGEDGPAGGA